MTYDLPPHIVEELLQFARRFLPRPDDLVEIRYEQLRHGIRATIVITPRIYGVISDESAYLFITEFANAMKNRGVGGDRPFVVIQAAKR